MKKGRRFVMAMSLVMLALAGIAYGCSDESKPGATKGGPLSDGSSGKDTSAPDSNPSDTGSDGTTKFTAKADIKPTSDASVVTGTATFTEENGEVTAVINITAGFPPGDAGLHGLHIHANGSCDANDGGPDGAILFGGAAGGHWNPLDASHGLPTAPSHHLGDMGNIQIADNGSGTLTLVSKDWTVQPGSKSIVGHAIIFHQQQDDGVSQPVGNAGARPGCGVIVLK
jgi:Cu-Zn family superoxide dismutase